MTTTLFKWTLLALLLTIAVRQSTVLAQRPGWFDQVNVLANKGAFDFPTTGGTWGFKPLEPEIEALIGTISYYHERGTFYHASMQFQNEWLGAHVDTAFAAIDFFGNPIPSGSDFEGNLHHPTWQDSLITWAKSIIDLGGDGVIIDGYFPNIRAIERAGGSFDGFTMEAFRAHLESKYSSNELQVQFDIADISTFNYGTWLKEHGFEAAPLNGQRIEGLLAEFWLFEWQFAVEFLSEFSQLTKEYAQINYGKDFLVSQNNAGTYYHSANTDDFFIGEFFYYQPGRKTTDLAASQIKVGKAIVEKPVVIFPEVVERVGEVNPPQHLENMIKLILADIYASGGISLTADWLQYLREGIYTTPLDLDQQTLATYTTFILNNPFLFESLVPISNVALVYSSASAFNSDIAVENWNDRLAFPIGYTGMSKMLIEANIQHDVLYFPDPRFPSDEVTAEQLSPYGCIILPNIFSMTDEQAALLLDYVQKGGTIIAAGATGTHNENGILASRPDLQALAVEGTHQFGDGVFMYFVDDMGRRYSDFADQTDKRLIVDQIDDYVAPQTIVSPNNPVSVFAYAKTDAAQQILHVVNYNYDPNADAFSPARDFTIDLLADEGTYQATSYSPDFASHQTYTTTWDSGYVNISVPVLEAYNIVVVEKNESAPQLQSTSPVRDTTIVAGDSLRFVVNAFDADGNKLLYDWVINGVLKVSTTVPEYWFIPDSVGRDTLEVRVSDGGFSVSHKWIIEILSGVAIEPEPSELPTEFSLSQNYPNPFNPTTTIVFALPRASDVTLDVYDVLGQKVALLVDEEMPPGSYSIQFDAATLASGMYLYRLQAGAYMETKKLLLLK